MSASVSLVTEVLSGWGVGPISFLVSGPSTEVSKSLVGLPPNIESYKLNNKTTSLGKVPYDVVCMDCI